MRGKDLLLVVEVLFGMIIAALTMGYVFGETMTTEMYLNTVIGLGIFTGVMVFFGWLAHLIFRDDPQPRPRKRRRHTRFETVRDRLAEEKPLYTYRRTVLEPATRASGEPVKETHVPEKRTLH